MAVTKPIYFHVENHLKDRMDIQAKRLGLKQSAFLRMALVKLLEEEEKIQEINARR
jgi:antitoxin component of RelBE/YafQ-DinJ toxin-antitoxin module